MNRQKLIDLCEEGLTLQEIANELGVSRQRVHQVLNEFPEVKERREKDRKAVTFVGKVEKLQKARRKYGNMTAKEFRSNALAQQQRYRLNVKKANCRSAGIEFDLAWGDLEWPTTCPVLGIALDYFGEAGKRNESSASFDRVDGTLGYVKGNVRVISWRANRIKNDGTAEEHKLIADYIDRCNEFQCE